MIILSLVERRQVPEMKLLDSSWPIVSLWEQMALHKVDNCAQPVIGCYNRITYQSDSHQSERTIPLCKEETRIRGYAYCLSCCQNYYQCVKLRTNFNKHGSWCTKSRLTSPSMNNPIVSRSTKMLAPALKKLKYVANDIVPCSLSSNTRSASSCIEHAPSLPIHTMFFSTTHLPCLHCLCCSLEG